MNLPPLPARVHISEHESGYVIYGYTDKQMQEYALAAMAQAGAEPEPEPVAWRVRNRSTPEYWIIFLHEPVDFMKDPEREVQPLYASPTAQPAEMATDHPAMETLFAIATHLGIDIEVERAKPDYDPCGKFSLTVIKAIQANATRQAPPPAREPLTDEQIAGLLDRTFSDDTLQPDDIALIRAIEAAHGIVPKP